MVLVLLVIILISPLIAVIPAGRQLLIGKRTIIDTLPVSFILGLFGLFYVPSLQVDLSRYFAQLDGLRMSSSFVAFFRGLDLANQFQISQQLFFYVVSRFSYNNLMPFLVVMLVATSGLYIIKDFALENTLSTRLMGFMCISFLLLMPWGVVITNIRWITGITLFMLATYRDLYQQKHTWVTWLIYFVGCTMHIAVIGFLAVRIGIFLLHLLLEDQHTYKKIGTLFILLVLFLVFTQTSLFRFFWEKAVMYLSGGSQGSGIQTWFDMADSSIGRRLGKYAEEFFTLSQIVLILPAVWRTYQDNNKRMMDIYLFSLAMLVLTFFLTLMPGTTWVRFAFMVAFCAVFIIMAEESYLKNDYLIVVNQSLWIGMLLWSIVWQIYQYTGSEIMTKGDYFNIIFPIWRLFQ